MKSIIYITTVVMLILLTYGDHNCQERKKLAQTGMKFLSVSTDARASGMNDAVTAVPTYSSSVFYNPANLAWIETVGEASFGTTKWIADINYLHGSLALNLFDGDYGIFGFSVIAVDYGTIMGTVVAPTEQGYLDIGEFSPTAMSIGLTYATALSQKFSIGGTVKYIEQDLGSSVTDIDAEGNRTVETNSVNTLAFDFGILYRTGFKSLDFGMSIRNFARELKYKEESFEIPLTFRVGLSINAFDFLEVDRNMHSFLFSVDAAHPRDYSEQLFLGGEYEFLQTFALRGGYVFPKDEGGFSAGFGIRRTIEGLTMAIDYAYTSFGTFDDTNNLFSGMDGIQRVTIKIAY